MITASFNSNSQHKQTLWQLPVRFKHFWLWPQLGVTVQSINRNHNSHIFWDRDSIDLNSFFGKSFQTWDWGVQPVDKVRLIPDKTIQHK